MDENRLLFSNKFISSNINNNYKNNISENERYRKYYEKKKEEEKRKNIISKSKRIMENENSAYSDFRSIQELPINNLINTNHNKIKLEKKTIVSIDSSNRDINKYPNQNDFTIFLQKSFYNVKKIELISTEFPNTDQVIKDTPIQLQNNIITWQNDEDIDLNFVTNLTINTIVTDYVDIFLDNHGYRIGDDLDVEIYNSKLDTDLNITGIIDGKKRITVIDSNTFRFPYIGGISGQGTTSIDFGFPTYTVTIKPGNYTASTLAEQLSNDMGLIKRRKGNGEFHYFEVKVNLDTDVMTLDSVITTLLPNNSISTTSGSFIITVNQLGHGFRTGDRVKMIGVKLTAGIPGYVLNGDFIVTVLDFNTFTYEVNIRASDTIDGGGNTIRTGRDAPFRILFDTENTKIQFNTGFPDEDSAEFINNTDPITTKSLKISNVEIISSDKVRFTTTIPHGLEVSSIRTISSISTGSNPIITTTTPHGLELPRRVTVRNTNSVPIIDGTYLAIPNGIYTFILQGLVINVSGNDGEIIYGGDQIRIFELQTVPSILIEPVYYVENIPSTNQFDITFRMTSVDSVSFEKTIIGTGQLFIEHPNHGFNTITTITSIDSIYANVKTFLSVDLVGSKTDNVSIIDGPIGTNTVDIILVSHGLSTSDKIIISNSTTDPVVDGTYNVQLVDLDTVRINYVHSTFVNGDGTIITGDQITITGSNSLPKVDGTYYINNRKLITSISTGVITSTITTSTVHNWSIGDIIVISESNSSPSIDGTHIIQSIVSPTSFEIDIVDEVVVSGTSGIVINNNNIIIELGYALISPGTSGIVGRNNKVLHYRVASNINGSDNIANIPLSVINGFEREIIRLIDSDNYMVRVLGDFANETLTTGGSKVIVSSLLHGFRSIQANTYDGNSTGILYRSISLEGENYLYLVSESESLEFNTVLNTSGIQNTLAKIILSESPGNYMFNSFISEPKVFDNPVSRINNMRFRVVTPEGYLFNFNDINYSFTLRITELIDQLENSYISSRTGGNEFSNLLNNTVNRSNIYEQTKDSGKSGSLDQSTGPGFVIRSEGGRGNSRVY